jgi:hypothetical protein
MIAWSTRALTWLNEVTSKAVMGRNAYRDSHPLYKLNKGRNEPLYFATHFRPGIRESYIRVSSSPFN